MKPAFLLALALSTNLFANNQPVNEYLRIVNFVEENSLYYPYRADVFTEVSRNLIGCVQNPGALLPCQVQPGTNDPNIPSFLLMLQQQLDVLGDKYARVLPFGTVQIRVPDRKNVVIEPTRTGSCVARLIYTQVQTQDALLMRQVLNNYRKEHPLCAVVLDLTKNGGGSVNDAVEVVDLFMSAAHIMSAYDKAGVRIVYRTYTDRTWLERLPLVVHVGASTASAAEFIAYAFGDLGRGVIVGGPTYGKGVAQEVFSSERLGVEVRVTKWIFERVNGRPYDGNPLVPKYSYEDWMTKVEQTAPYALSQHFRTPTYAQTR